MSHKQWQGPLELTRSASPIVASATLATAHVIADIATVSYSEGYHSPNPDLNQMCEPLVFFEVFDNFYL